MSDRRSTKHVENLLDKMVDVFDHILTHGEEEVTREGEVIRIKPKPATLNVIRQFIDAQGVKVLVEKNPAVQRVSAKLLALPIQPNETDFKDKVG